MNLYIRKIQKNFKHFQKIYGDKMLDPIYGCGEISSPKICFVFMNPTGRNVSANKDWKGIKAPWIGTKNVWNMLYKLGFLEEEMIYKINSKKPEEWNPVFAKQVYSKIKDNSLYITNLAKATQADARPLKNEVFNKYLSLFREEIKIIKPKIIITFGNQVSSIVIKRNIKVSDYRKKFEEANIDGKIFKVFPIYYPVGQGTRNIEKAKEDIKWIVENF